MAVIDALQTVVWQAAPLLHACAQHRLRWLYQRAMHAHDRHDPCTVGNNALVNLVWYWGKPFGCPKGLLNILVPTAQDYCSGHFRFVQQNGNLWDRFCRALGLHERRTQDLPHCLLELGIHDMERLKNDFGLHYIAKLYSASGHDYDSALATLLRSRVKYNQS